MAVTLLVQAELRTFLAERGCTAAQHVLAAVSGGPDSLALWHALRELERAGGPRVTAVHINHGLRGAASEADAEAVAALAAAWQAPLEIVTLALAAGTTPAAARRARYRALAALAIDTAAAAVITAHQADDQAETVLHHLIRGSGPTGLSGMAPITAAEVWAAGAPLLPAAPLWRPLLSTARAVLADYCRAAGLSARDDATNRDQRYLRTRLRTRLLPMLQQENAQVTAAIGRTARLLADEQDFLAHELALRWPQLVRRTDSGRIACDRRLFREQHIAVQRAAVRHACALLGVSELSYAATAQIIELVTGQAGGRLRSVDGLYCSADQHEWVLSRSAAAPIDGPQLLNPGAAAADAQLAPGWELLLQQTAPQQPDRWWYPLDAALPATLSWRHRRAGDRLRPAGAPGSRRVQDILVDRRVARAARAAWPLLVSRDEPIWIPGVAGSAQPADRQTRATIWIGIVRTTAQQQE